jgi:hypothetical protein
VLLSECLHPRRGSFIPLAVYHPHFSPSAPHLRARARSVAKSPRFLPHSLIPLTILFARVFSSALTLL